MCVHDSDTTLSGCDSILYFSLSLSRLCQKVVVAACRVEKHSRHPKNQKLYLHFKSLAARSTPHTITGRVRVEEWIFSQHFSCSTYFLAKNKIIRFSSLFFFASFGSLCFVSIFRRTQQLNNIIIAFASKWFSQQSTDESLTIYSNSNSNVRRSFVCHLYCGAVWRLM